MDIIELATRFVESECEKPSSHYKGILESHIHPTVDIAQTLVGMYGGDREIVVVATSLHDIGAIIHGRKDHHTTGAEIVEDKLREWGYSEKRVQLVRRCVLCHRGSEEPLPESLEEQIVAHADAMSAFSNITGLFRASFIEEKLKEEAARVSVLEKLQRKWNQLIFEEARNMIFPKYKAAMLLLG